MLVDALEKIQRTEIDDGVMSLFGSEAEFMSLSVSLMIEVGQYACLAGGTTGREKTWDRDHAAVGGNMVRLYKLIDSYLDQTCQMRDEISFILARLVAETAINVRYLMKNFSTELIDSYVSQSFRHEKRQWDTVHRNIESRSGVMLPIEDRILQSISRSISAAKIDLSSIDLKDKSPWGRKDIKQKFDDVYGQKGSEQIYRAVIGGPSHSVHGNWQEIYGKHLELRNDGSFSPALAWKRPRPQVINALGGIVIDALQEYFPFMCGEEARELFGPRLSDLRVRIDQVIFSHEAYLAKKAWPET